MIDEAVLEQLLAQAGGEISVPADGPQNVERALAVSSTPSRPYATQLRKAVRGGGRGRSRCCTARGSDAAEWVGIEEFDRG